MADDMIMEVLSEGEVLAELFKLPEEYKRICTQLLTTHKHTHRR